MYCFEITIPKSILIANNFKQNLQWKQNSLLETIVSTIADSDLLWASCGN